MGSVNLHQHHPRYCDVCGVVLTGKKIFCCSNACKMRAYRQRKKAKTLRLLHK